MQWKRKVSSVRDRAIGPRADRAQDGIGPGQQSAAASSSPNAPKRNKPKDVSPPPAQVAASARPPADPEHDRLLRAPVIVLSPPRSGSTLLRVVLNSHPELHAPHETHVRRLAVKLTTPPVAHSMEGFGHNLADIEHMLWDRMLHRELVRSGKKTVVEKTPSNVFVWQRLATCWPDARFIFLMRHPMSIATSWHEGDPAKRPMAKAVPHTLKYMVAPEEARAGLPGLTLRYEELTSDPETQTRRICEFLGLEWEPGMVTYGKKDHGPYVKGIGDWKEKIKTGTIQQGRPLPKPEEIAEELREMCRVWGYLPADAPAHS
ncbi:sulfotransferase family protein [Streptomyces sp. 4N509B]|uniref:sulfotransferase family protein n=1 Tax=Streptomyces sp. 4N509B TaxID=3457413 RepID=UPI003FD06FA0